LSRYLASAKMTRVRIPRVAEIPSPYSFGPDHVVYLDEKNRCVFVVETSHKTYDVFRASDFVKLAVQS
jgi:hypothetical protein